jgi:hypothetical protein
MAKQVKAKVPTSGILSEVSGVDLPRDFVTWHDLLPYRIWIHSRSYKDGYKPISVELEWVGPNPSKLSDDEGDYRIKLAAQRKCDAETAELGPSTFRSIPFGAVLELHSDLVTKHRLQRIGKRNFDQFQMVRDFEMETYVDMDSLETNGSSSSFENKELRASNSDSILIAYFYSQQTQNGSKKPAQMTAKYLGIEINLVYAAVKIARKKGWLTSNGVGTGGGVLTDEGKKAYKESESSAKVSEYLKNYFKALKADMENLGK